MSDSQVPARPLRRFRSLTGACRITYNAPAMRPLPAILLLLLGLVCTGCARNQIPQLPLTVVEARRDWHAMEQAPVKLERPVLILSGYRDPGFIPHRLVPVLRRLTGDDRVIGLAYPFARDFNACRRRVIRFVDENFPTDDPHQTTEVDVIAISMGGLIARYAASELPGRPEGRRLRIARLFTISTPHRGARLARLPTFNRLQIDMRRGSDFLAGLDEMDGKRSYELYCYVRQRDLTVGADNAAPPGHTAVRVPNRFLQMPHTGAMDDPRILADIARRLRGEPPHARPIPPNPAGDR